MRASRRGKYPGSRAALVRSKRLGRPALDAEAAASGSPFTAPGIAAALALPGPPPLLV